MRLVFITFLAFLLHGCAATHSMSPPVDKEAFAAGGKSVAVKYNAVDTCPSNMVFVIEPCRGGNGDERAAELIDVLSGYGFKAYRAGATDSQPDYVMVVNETVASGSDIDSVKSLGFMMLSSFTIGVFPVISDSRPAQLSYALYKGHESAATQLHKQSATTRVGTLGGIYFLVMGPANYGANKASLMTEHERALQNWIQGGLFE